MKETVQIIYKPYKKEIFIYIDVENFVKMHTISGNIVK